MRMKIAIDRRVKRIQDALKVHEPDEELRKLLVNIAGEVFEKIKIDRSAAEHETLKFFFVYFF